MPIGSLTFLWLSIVIMVTEAQIYLIPITEEISKIGRTIAVSMLYVLPAFFIGMYLWIIYSDRPPKDADFLRASLKGHEWSRNIYGFGIAMYALVWLVVPEFSRGDSLAYIFTIMFSTTAYTISRLEKAQSLIALSQQQKPPADHEQGTLDSITHQDKYPHTVHHRYHRLAYYTRTGSVGSRLPRTSGRNKF